MIKVGFIGVALSFVLLFMGELPGDGGLQIIKRGTAIDQLRGIGMLIGFFGGGFLLAVAAVSAVLGGVKDIFKD